MDITITSKNWARHLRSKRHLRNDPDQTLRPRSRKRGRPNQTIACKELLEQAKEYNIKGYTKWNKQNLLTVLCKVKKLLFKKHDLLQLNKDHLINIAKENNIKVNLRKKKDQIIEAILKTQDCIFHKIAASELSFHDDLVEPTKEDRKPAYTITETKSRFNQKFNATETVLTIKMNKIIETKNAIKGLINHAKEKGNYKKGDKMQIIVSNPGFHHDIFTTVQSDLKGAEFMQHIVKILSSNKYLDITQCIFTVKSFNIPHGS
ncbi:MAG: Rho termination factor N-terminal domain-containing protein [Candidatus Bathyarchaeota archaeon]|uniref:Rho termination factor N-terminal domain-containing protein n=1 Tax=Candidatus Bathycorpusculum sp. TaxID=2994959 RepID=UPI002831F7CA|nr:Rho termination factor N-terminal domain-containing protein [Candidatus Termiticorpusculum sp.]